MSLYNCITRDIWFQTYIDYFISIRKLIQFGLMQDLIRHLQKYPVLNGDYDDVPTALIQ